ncbi:hypothetical protein DM05_4941 [Pseudomonas poae]|uniref:Uncharacterized protein n=1 Tax=Pseudomonas poae TaxID=200451 RepID=A0A7Z1GMU8_9PSED|nr:hypothetical protein [Pseudomonas poae]PFG60235.1 hypothetical protein DM05_4941 [Pseudomonas poae]
MDFKGYQTPGWLSRLRRSLVTAALVITLAPVGQAPAADLKPLHFATVGEMIEDLGDYAAENGTFKLLSTEPLKIQLAPSIVPGDLPENNAREIRRAALYGVYRTLVHTDADKVTSVAVPREVNIREQTSKVLSRPSLSITVTRAQALKAAGLFLKVQSAADLVRPEQAGTIQLDNWAPKFEDAYMTDKGQIRLLEAIKAAGGDLVNNG